MKFGTFCKFAWFGITTIVFRRKKPILGTIILTDKCNLHCKHCSVNNIQCEIYPYQNIKDEMTKLYKMGVRILFFCGGETFLWQDGEKDLKSLVAEAKQMGFSIVNVVTNGTFAIDLPQADLILLSLDGGKEIHNQIRGETFDIIMQNIRQATADNICLYMAINQLNKGEIQKVCQIAKEEKNIRAVSFNFHTPYPDTLDLQLTHQDKQKCAEVIKQMIEQKMPVFNLKSALPYIVDNNFKTPCHQCVVMEKGELSVCGRCVHVEGLCQKCGYFFSAEYSLLFEGKLKIIFDMLKTYLKYI